LTFLGTLIEAGALLFALVIVEIGPGCARWAGLQNLFKGASMRRQFALTLATLALTSSLASVFPSMAKADGLENGIFFKGTTSLTKITLVKDGTETTYSVSPKIAGQMELGYKQSNLSFGSVSRCAPYLGEVAKETRIEAMITSAKTMEYGSQEKETPFPEKLGAATLVVPAGASAYGVCGGKNQGELTELLIQTRGGASIAVENTK